MTGSEPVCSYILHMDVVCLHTRLLWSENKMSIHFEFNAIQCDVPFMNWVKLLKKISSLFYCNLPVTAIALHIYIFSISWIFIRDTFNNLSCLLFTHYCGQTKLIFIELESMIENQFFASPERSICKGMPLTLIPVMLLIFLFILNMECPVFYIDYNKDMPFC